MGEIIAFPVPTVTEAPTYCVMEGEEELVLCSTQAGARNIARILAAEWVGHEYTVQTEEGETIFTVLFEAEEEEPE